MSRVEKGLLVEREVGNEERSSPFGGGGRKEEEEEEGSVGGWEGFVVGGIVGEKESVNDL